MMTELLTPKQVAKVLHVSPQLVRAYCHDGIIPAFKIGTLWRIHPADLARYLEAKRSMRQGGESGGTKVLELHVPG